MCIQLLALSIFTMVQVGYTPRYGQYVAYTPRGLQPSVYKTTYRPLPCCITYTLRMYIDLNI